MDIVIDEDLVISLLLLFQMNSIYESWKTTYVQSIKTKGQSQELNRTRHLVQML